MKMNFVEYIRKSDKRLAMPIGVYAGLEIIKASVQDAVTKPDIQAQAVLALHKRFHTLAMLTAMDLSTEAETFGCEIRMSKEEIPTVIGRRATSLADIQALPDPRPGDARTSVHLESAKNLVRADNGTAVLGGTIGPFSLAGRIYGVSEALELTLSEPEHMALLLDKVTKFLIGYALAFREVGAQGVIMAEPAAGLLSPRGLAEFSAPYVKKVIRAVETDHFKVILHNCGAKLVHLPKVLESGASFYHLGAPMDLPAALKNVDPHIVLAGNLDPSAIFREGTPQQIHDHTEKLLQATAAYPNYVLSSGCDLPPGTPVANLDAFYQALQEFNNRK